MMMFIPEVEEGKLVLSAHVAEHGLIEIRQSNLVLNWQAHIRGLDVTVKQ
jgi:hypothetical protein